MTTNNSYRFRFPGSSEVFTVTATTEREAAARLMSLASGREVPAKTLSVNGALYSTRRRVATPSVLAIASAL